MVSSELLCEPIWLWIFYPIMAPSLLSIFLFYEFFSLFASEVSFPGVLGIKEASLLCAGLWLFVFAFLDANFKSVPF